MFDLFSNEIIKDPDCSWPIGNGHMGTRVTGDYSHSVFSLSDDTFLIGRKIEGEPLYASQNIPSIRKHIVDNETEKAERLAESNMLSRHKSSTIYGEIGRLAINVSRETFAFCRKLSLEKGVYSENSIDEKGIYIKNVFSSFSDNVLVVTYRFPVSLSVDISFDSLNGKEYILEGEDIIALGGRLKKDIDGSNDGGLDYTVAFRYRTDGIASGIKERLYITDATFLTLIIYSETDYDIDLLGPNRNKNTLSKVVDKLNTIDISDSMRLLKDHCDLYYGSFSRSSVHICSDVGNEPDNYIDLAKYLLLSSSGPFSTLPSGAGGFWKCSKNDFNIDGPFQMRYWPAHALNLSDITEVVNRYIYTLSSAGEKTAALTYGFGSGWTLNKVADPFGNLFLTNSLKESYFPQGGGWLSRALISYYEYTGNEDLVRTTFFPVLLESCQFYEKLFLIGDKCKHALNPTSSHGNLYYDKNNSPHYLCHGETFGQMLCEELYLDVVSLGDLYTLEDRKVYSRKLSNLRRKTSRLIPYRISERYGGKLCEWTEDFEEAEDSGHIYHLFGAYPGNVVSNRKEAELLTAAKISADRIYKREAGDLFTLVWLFNIYARLRSQNEYIRVLEDVIVSLNVSRETFYYSPYLSAFCSGITEALIQSHEGVAGKRKIRPYPLLPSRWKKGCAKGLRVRGAITADLNWDEKTLELDLTADKDSDIELVFDDNDIIMLNDDRVRIYDNTLSCRLKKDKKYHFEYERGSQ